MSHQHTEQQIGQDIWKKEGTDHQLGGLRTMREHTKQLHFGVRDSEN